MSTTVADLEYAIAKATENIRKADKLRMTGLAQQTRRDRKALIAKLEGLSK